MALAKSIRSFKQFRSELESDPELQKQFQQDPVSAVKQFHQKDPLRTDPWIYRIIVIALGATILTIMAGILLLISKGSLSGDQSVPTIFTAIASAAIGALAGLLAPAPGSETKNDS